MKADPAFVSIVGAVVHCQMAPFRTETSSPPTVGSGSHWWLAGDDFSRSWPRLMRVALPKLGPPSQEAAYNHRLTVEGTLRTGALVSVGKNRGPELLSQLKSMLWCITTQPFCARCCFPNPLSRGCPQTYSPINFCVYISIEPMFREVWPMMAFWNAH